MRVKDLATLERLLAQKRADAAGGTVVQRLRTPQPDGGGPTTPATPQQRIIGLDVALRCTGWGIIDVRRTPFRMSAVDCGIVRNEAKLPLSACLRNLAAAIRDLSAQYHPDLAVIEGGFYCKNVRTATVLGSARGAVIAMLADADIPVFEYAPRKIKQTICGFGNASKQQVALLVAQFLDIQVSSISNDATDALAMALTHAQLTSGAGALQPPAPL